MIHRLRHALERDLLAACQDADGIIADVVLAYHATCLIEKYQLPLLTVALVPWVPPTGDFAYPLLATMRLPGFLNRLTFKLHYELVWRTYRSDIIEWREELGLATNRAWVRLGGSNPRIPVVHAYSKHLLPVPRTQLRGTLTQASSASQPCLRILYRMSCPTGSSRGTPHLSGFWEHAYC